MSNNIENGTFDNLRKSFLEEAGLVLKYMYFARIAKFEGRSDLFNLFESFAENGIHCAHGALDFLKEVGDPCTNHSIGESKNNLDSLLIQELSGQMEKLPEMVNRAREVGNSDIASWFETLEKLKRERVEQLKGIKERSEERS